MNNICYHIEIHIKCISELHKKEVFELDQEKIGKFIAACRKDQGFTQAKLAERLGLTDRAVSKWENGKSMPDASIMLDLCELLKINVNELLSGERLDTASYKEKAEDLAFFCSQKSTILLSVGWPV